eukprot:TRINITY_DN3681_c0_g1_i5.p1 TRINITY_DN3681_c0_g1~~TRINITY_DN3681_c0_g1_i5.p1  ORF type:complete len:1029 (-),score=152.81 TRINITY_DN3681_c0_g1_i5:165-3188(-)
MLTFANTDIGQAALDIHGNISPLWAEVVVVLCLTLTCFLLRSWKVRSGKAAKRVKKMIELPSSITCGPSVFGELDAETVRTASSESVVAVYRKSEETIVLSPGLLGYVAAAFVKENSAELLDVVREQLVRNKRLRSAASCEMLVDITGEAGEISVMQDLVSLFSEDFSIATTQSMYASMACAYAGAGSVDRMEACLQKVERSSLTGRGCCKMLRGVLKARDPDGAKRLAVIMNEVGYTITTYLVTNIYACFIEAGRADVVDLVDELHPTSYASTNVMAFCRKRRDVQMAQKFLHAVERVGCEMPQKGLDYFVMLLVACGDPTAHSEFKKLCSAACPTEAFMVSVMLSCIDSKFLGFALIVAESARMMLRSGMTPSLYSAFMKVYASCDKHDKACELYDEMLDRGITADQSMSAHIVSCAEKCGRHELASSLAHSKPELRVLRFMSLLRSCAKLKDVDKAMTVLSEARVGGLCDHILFNAALNVCAVAGDTQKALMLLEQMHEHSKPDLVSYNTVLKAYAANQDLVGARALLVKMDAVGIPPNDVSFNVLVNMTASVSSLHEVWKVVKEMTDRGVAVDHFTISVLLKAANKTNCVGDLTNVFDLMDSLKIDVCADEVLMNSVLKMCLSHDLRDRIRSILDGYSLQRLKPAQHSYGLLIRAAGAVGDMQRCSKLWEEMVNVRCIEPSPAVLSCMVVAFGSNAMWEEASALIETNRDSLAASTPMYAALVTAINFPAKGLDAIDKLRATTFTMTTVFYNLLLDASLRSKNLRYFQKLLQMMEEDGCAADSYTASLEVKASCMAGDIKGALDAFDRARRIGESDADTVAFNTLLDGCVRHNSVALAEHLLASLEEYAITPTAYTLCIAVKMWGRRREIEKCFATVEAFAQRYGITANAPVNTCLMSACVLNCDIVRAVQVYKTIVAAGQTLEAKAQWAMVQQCLRHRRLDDAVVLLDLPGSVSVREIDNDAFVLIASAMKREGRMRDLGVPLFKRLREAGVRCPAVMRKWC